MGYIKNKLRGWRYYTVVRTTYRTQVRNPFRLITSPLRVLPDFVIIGAMKSGTTSLYWFVTEHPAIARAPKKEIHYFSSRWCYRHGELWYRSNFPTRRAGYRFHKRTGQKLLSGEATPRYLFDPATPGKIKELLPDVKLIVILRNPVDRAYSHYQHLLRKYGVSCSFEKAIAMQMSAPDCKTAFNGREQYISKGLYAVQLENWFKYYDRERFLILAQKDMRRDTQQTLDQVFEFLGVTPFMVKNPKDRNTREYEKMDEKTRRLLVEYFKPHNERLYKLLGSRFDWDK